MSALDELKAGETGIEFYRLLSRTVAAVAAARNFPPPEGNRWTPDQVDDIARAYIAHHRTPRAVAQMVLKCGDDQALAHYLQGVVRNFLRDRGRTTELGRLTMRVRRALRDNEAYTRATGDYWTFAAGLDEPSTVSPDDLIAAAATVEVTPVAWSADSDRNAPFASKETIEALLNAVLERAGGSVRAPDIARAIAPTLLVVVGTETVELDAGDNPDLEWHTRERDTTADTVVDGDRAYEIFGLLTDRQRISIARPELTVRELADLIGLGSSQAHIIRKQAIEAIRGEVEGEGNAHVVAELVIELAKMWIDDRTEPFDMTYGSA